MASDTPRRQRRRPQADIPRPGEDTRDYGARCPAPCQLRQFYSRDQARRYARTVQARQGRLRTFRHGRWWHLVPLTAAEIAAIRRPDEAAAA